MTDYKYQQIRKALIARIGRMLPGDRLPNRTELATELGVARTTLEHAISDLTALGVLHSRRGSGTYATGKTLDEHSTADPMERWESLPAATARDPNTWALLVANVMHDITPVLVRGAEDEAQRHGVRLIVCNTDDDMEKQNDYLYQLATGGVSGILIMPSSLCITDPRIWKALRAHGMQVVSCFRPLIGFQTPGVYCNSHLAGFLAAEHLIACGCRRIAMIAGALYPLVFDRYHGLRTALHAHRLVADASLFSYEDEMDLRAGDRPRAHALIEQAQYDGLFLFNDRLARYVYAELALRGKQPGREVAVVSCDNTEICETLAPTLSSIHFPVYEVGRRAAKLLYSLCVGERVCPLVSILDCSLHPRQSSLLFRRIL
ncbi:MAG TPA: GntR family transcriptional regulator [Clostridia bacterium]|nr:GntR family transcriptional regulator [Clostridia bacterium]